MLALLPLAAAAVEHVTVEVEVGRPAHGLVVGVVDVPVEQVLAIVMDCEGSERWFPDLEGTHTIAPGRCAGSTDLPWPVPDRVWQIDTAAEGTGDRRVASFAYVEGSGNLDVMHGHYVLEALDGARTRVTYEGWIDPGFWVPQPLIAWATARVLPGILDGIEREAESRSVTAARTQTPTTDRRS